MFLNLALAVLYFGAARLSLLVVHPDLKVTAVWLPSGLAIAAVLLHGRRMLPGVVAGDLVAGIAFGSAPGAAVLVAMAGSVEAVVGARLMQAPPSVAAGQPGATMQDVMRYVFRSAVLAPLASSLLGTGALMLAGVVGRPDAAKAVAMWWTGDVVGILLVIPLVLMRVMRRPADEPRIGGPVLVITALAVAAWVFLQPRTPDARGHALALLVFPPLAWNAFTGSARLVTVGNLGVALVAIAGTAAGLGPYATSDNATDVWYLQAFIVAYTVSTLLLRGAIEDQRRLHWRATEVERHFAAAADHGLHAILILGREHAPGEAPELRIVYANARARALFRKEAPSSGWHRLSAALPDLADAAWRERFDRVLREHAVEESMAVLDAPGRAPGWFRCSIIPLDDGLMVTLLDITDRVRADRALQVSELRYRLAAVGGHVWDWDVASGRISIAPEWWQRLGWPVPDAADLVERFESVLHPDDRPRRREALRRHLGERVPYDLEFRIRDATGSWRWYHTQGQALWAEDGTATYMAGTSFDITDRKHAEEALRASEAYRRSLFEQLGDGVLLFDARGRVLDANPRVLEMLGYTREAMLSRRLSDLVAPFEADRLGDDLGGIAQPNTATAEWEYVRQDGSAFPAEITLRALEGERHLAVVRDVTERRNAQRSLLAYQSELSELTQRLMHQEQETTRRVAQALHDQLGQTLAAARLHLDAVLAATPGAGGVPPDVARLAPLIETAIREVRVMLSELRPPLLEDHGLGAALDNEIRSRAIAGARPAVQLDIAPEAAECRWPTDVEYGAFMVAREAIGNALLHSRAAAISVRLDGGEGRLDLDVTDDGIGIPLPMVAGRPGHLGIVGMRERAIAIGGRLIVEGAAAGGTHVGLRWAEEQR